MKYTPMFDKIDLHLIRVLHTVLVERNVSRAAVRLGMSQPAVSTVQPAGRGKSPICCAASRMGR